MYDNHRLHHSKDPYQACLKHALSHFNLKKMYLVNEENQVIRVKDENGYWRKLIFSNITRDDVERQKIAQGGYSYFHGFKIDMNEVYVSRSLAAPSIDRLDVNKGYIIGNFVLTTRWENRARCDASLDQLDKFYKDHPEYFNFPIDKSVYHNIYIPNNPKFEYIAQIVPHIKGFLEDDWE